LFSFSWTSSEDGDKLIVLGGSDGNLLMSDLFIFDFSNSTCTHKSTDFEF